jgi:hypothetical protein
MSSIPKKIQSSRFRASASAGFFKSIIKGGFHEQTSKANH